MIFEIGSAGSYMKTHAPSYALLIWRGIRKQFQMACYQVKDRFLKSL